MLFFAVKLQRIELRIERTGRGLGEATELLNDNEKIGLNFYNLITLCDNEFEVSCDDTAVCILNSNKKILSSRRYANREVQKRLGGICPAVAADQVHYFHRYILYFLDFLKDLQRTSFYELKKDYSNFKHEPKFTAI